MSRVGHGAPELVLASASPRRLEILRSIGIEPTVDAASLDERAIEGEKPADLVERLARAKAETVAGRAPVVGETTDRLVVGADTVIDLDGAILGKPADRAEAERMLRSLSARDHSVLTGVAVVGRLGARSVTASAVARTVVTMRPFGQVDLDWYLDTGEFVGKAGAYAIQGFGSLLVSGIEGSYHNVVGLPVDTLDRLLGEVGVPLREVVGP